MKDNHYNISIYYIKNNFAKDVFIYFRTSETEKLIQLTIVMPITNDPKQLFNTMIHLFKELHFKQNFREKNSWSFIMDPQFVVLMNSATRIKITERSIFH